MSITRPILRHPELYALFEYGLDIPDAILDPILALPRESLRTDLETLVRLLIDTDIESLEETEEQWFPFHALMLLAELRMEESLPLILEVLRMADDDLYYWFGDLSLEEFWAIVLWCGQHQISALVEFIKDAGVPNNFMRSLAVETLGQLVFHFPERRAEILKTLGDLLAYFNQLETFDETDLNPATEVTNTLADLEVREYLPAIQELYEKDRVDEFVRGDWEMYLEEFGDIYNSKRPLWTRYREWLNTRGKYWLEMEAENERYALEAEKRRLEKVEKDENRRLKEDKQKALLQMHQLVGGGPKIGRNDPCPCGSGKKYKKCCGANL